MKNKNIFVFGMIGLIIFIGIASYLWYLYFHEYEGKLIAQNEDLAFMRGVEFVNSGPIDYVNAKTEDDDSIIPIYYFRIKNNSETNFDYELVLEEAKDKSSSFTRGELQYELKLDNKTIKTGGLDTISNNILDTNIIKSNSINDYSLKIKLKDDITDYENKEYHYIVTLKEKK